MSPVKLIVVAGLGYFVYIKWQEGKDLEWMKKLTGTQQHEGGFPDRTIMPGGQDPAFNDPRYKVTNPTHVQNPYQGFAVGEPVRLVRKPGASDMGYIM